MARPSQLRHAEHVQVSLIDPRDQDWEDPHPRYRVYFHDAGGRSYEYEISGSDIVEVLAWANANREGRSYVLYACTQSEGLGLLRLQGQDPNEPSTR